MNKVLLILKREYLTRVKKKSFIILTLLMPVLFGAIMILPGYLATKESNKEHKVAVVDRTNVFLGELKNSKSTIFEFVKNDRYDKIKGNLKNNQYYALLEIPQNITTTNTVYVYSHKQISIDVKNHIDRQIKNKMESQKRAALVEKIGVPDLEEKIKSTKTKISVETIKMSEGKKGKKGSTELAMGIGYGAGFLIYIFVFMYGSMVMRGVLEEKQNRIVEVIISSVKPVQLMLGKIIGLAAVGLTQFLIWILLIGAILFGVKSLLIPDDKMQQIAQSQTENIMVSANSQQLNDFIDKDQSEIEEIITQIENIDFTQIIFTFIIFFILGYLLYSSLMAAIASAVDSEEDMQQFMFPVTIPLIAAIIMLVNVIKNPEGELAFWGSHIPFTSPIIMMVRIPFGVPWWEIAISMGILAATTYGCIWIAAKIYRTGILMYGKKPTWRELGKWLTYKN